MRKEKPLRLVLIRYVGGSGWRWIRSREPRWILERKWMSTIFLSKDVSYFRIYFKTKWKYERRRRRGRIICEQIKYCTSVAVWICPDTRMFPLKFHNRRLDKVPAKIKIFCENYRKLPSRSLLNSLIFIKIENHKISIRVRWAEADKRHVRDLGGW